ncbi:MAG: DMT family transporter [Candidatus Berkiellales bacterium]
MLTKSMATMLGLFAMLLWAAGTTLVVFLEQIPLAQMLTISWLICFIFYAVLLTLRKEWYKIKQPWYVWLIGTFGLCGTHFVTICALKAAPPAQAHLLTALWPIFVALLSGWLLKENGTKIFLTCAVMGFIGVWCLLTDGKGLGGYQWEYSLGYLFAVISSLLWGTYIILSRKYRDVPPEMVGMYSGIGALFAVVLHVFFEDFAIPTPFEWGMLFLKGIATTVIAYYCWEVGIKRGHLPLLSIFYYFNPVIAIIILIIFDFAKPQLMLLFSSAIISSAALLCIYLYRRQGNEILSNKK